MCVNAALLSCKNFVVIFDIHFFFRSNFSDLEIEMFFCQFDVDGNVLLDCLETNKVLSELGEKKNPENPETRPGTMIVA